MTKRRPGAEPSKREVQFFVLADCSSSMIEKGKIESLNRSIREALPHLKSKASEQTSAKLCLKVIKFNSVAEWHIKESTSIEDFKWVDLQATGSTAMGSALKLVAEELKNISKGQRLLPPVILLVTDGYPTDDFDSGLNELLSTRWGKKAVRIALAIGDNADRNLLTRFIDNPTIKVLEADTPEAIAEQIVWVSTIVESMLEQSSINFEELSQDQSFPNSII